MNRAPAFQFYAADFETATSSWTTSEVGIYLRLLIAEWINGSLPDDTKRLSQIARIDHGNFKKTWYPLVRGKFIINGEGNLINKRLEQVREEQRKYIESQRLKGQKRAAKMWPKDIAPAIPTANIRLQPEDSSSSLKDKEDIKRLSSSLELSIKELDNSMSVCTDVINYLNEKTGHQYKPTQRNISHIKARLREGFTLEDFKLVIDYKAKDSYFLEHPEYMRPKTLFSGNFESYLNAAKANPIRKSSRHASDEDLNRLFEEK